MFARDLIVSCIAVTGATGRIGQCLVRFLRARHHKVYELSRKDRHESAAWIYCDLTRIEALKVPADVDCVIHAAHDFSTTTWKEMENVNIKGTIGLFERVADAGCANSIFISSMAAFDGAQSNYGRAKKTLEEILLPRGVICVRPGLVYGAGEGLVEGIRRQVTSRRIVPLIDGGKQTLYLVAANNLCLALSQIVANPTPFSGRPVVLAARTPTTLRELAVALAGQAQKAPWFVPVPSVLVVPILRLCEMLTTRLPFKSDNVVSLRAQCREPFKGNLFIDVEPDEDSKIGL